MRLIPARHMMKAIVEPSIEALPSVQLEDVESGTGRLIQELTVQSPGQNRFQPGDVLFGKLRPYLSKSLIVSRDLQGSGEFLCLRPASQTDQRFLFYLTLSRVWLDHAMISVSGAKMPRTSWEEMAGLEVPSWAMGEQRRIADFLDDRVARIDQIIDGRRRQRELLAEQSSAVADDLMEESIAPWVRLGKFVLLIEQGWSPQCDSQPAEIGEWGVTKVGAVQRGWFDESQNKHLPETEQPKPEYEVKARDLLVSRANTPERVGFFAVVPDSVRQRLILCDKIMRIRLDSHLTPEFVSLIGQARRTRDRFTLAGTGTSDSMVNIRGDDIRDLRLPLLSLGDQIRWVKRSQERHEFARAALATLEDSVALLAEYKKSLITAAVTGELDVTTATTRVPGE